MIQFVCLPGFSQEKDYEVPKKHFSFFIDSMKKQDILDTIRVQKGTYHKYYSIATKLYVVNEKYMFALNTGTAPYYEAFKKSVMQPKNIKKIKVMYGSRAGSIYGPDGVNGVIIIKTKRSVHPPIIAPGPPTDYFKRS